MVSLEQVRQLEAKVNRAVEIIRVLKEENRTLRRTVDASQSRMKDLEDLVRAFKSDQAEIERGLVNAIHKLDLLEDGLDGAARPSLAPAQATSATQASPRPEPEAQPVAAAARPAVEADPPEDPAGEADQDRPAGQLDIF